MPSVSLTTQGLPGMSGTSVSKTSANTAAAKDVNAVFDRSLSDFNAHALDGYATGAGPLRTQGASNDTVLRPQPVTSVGAQRTWNHQQPDGTAVVISATLRQQVTAQDGRIINLWGEDSEYGTSKISDSIIGTLINKFASGGQSVYTLLLWADQESSCPPRCAKQLPPPAAP